MAFQEKEMNADGYLKKLLEKPTVIGYIVFNKEGIAMRYGGKGLTNEKAVHYAALMTDYWAIIKKTIGRTLKSVFNPQGQQNQDCDIEYVRFRTKKKTEIIVTSYSDFFLVCIQNCGGKIVEENDDEENEQEEDNQKKKFYLY